MKKIICIILVMIMMSGLLACVKKDNPAEITSAKTEDVTTLITDTTTALVPNLPDVKYDGYEFKIANAAYGNTKYTYSYLTAENETGNPIADATFKRNQKILDQFGVTVADINVTTAEFTTLQASQDNTYALATVDLSHVMSLVTKGYAIDFNNISTIDLSMPWWDQNARVKLSVNNKLYYTFSDFTIYALDNTRAVYFNKNLILDLGLESPYQLVEDNQWTVEKMIVMGIDAVQDNGDGIYDSNDRYGIVNTATTVYEAMLTGCNAEIVKQGDDGVPYFCCFDEKDYFVSVYNFLLEQFNRNNVYYISDTNTERTMFASGNALFVVDTLLEASILRMEEIDFGILPVPKYSSEQESYLNVSPNPHALLIPKSSEDTDRTGVILEALSYYSSNYYSENALIPQYFELTLQSKSATDLASAESLQIIHDNVSYVIKIVGTDFSSTIFQSYFATNNAAIVSLIDSSKLSQNRLLETAVDTITKLN